MPRTSGPRPIGSLPASCQRPLDGDLHPDRLRPFARRWRTAMPHVHLSYHGLDLDPFRPVREPAPAARRIASGSDPVLDPQRWPRRREEGLRRPAQGARRCCPTICTGGSSISAAASSWTDASRLWPTELGIADRIHWHGALAQEEVLEHYRGADIFALACRIAADGDRDGLPNVLVEASSQRPRLRLDQRFRRAGTARRWRERPGRPAGRPTALAAALDSAPSATGAAPDGSARLRKRAVRSAFRPSCQHRPAEGAVRTRSGGRCHDRRRESSSMSSICSASAIWRAPAALPRRLPTTAST